MRAAIHTDLASQPACWTLCLLEFSSAAAGQCNLSVVLVEKVENQMEPASWYKLRVNPW